MPPSRNQRPGCFLTLVPLFILPLGGFLVAALTLLP